MAFSSNTTDRLDAVEQLRLLNQQLEAGGGLQPMAQESTAFRPYAGGGVMEDLRKVRDNLLLERFANNIIQQAAAPILAPVAGILEKIPALNLVKQMTGSGTLLGASIGAASAPQASVLDVIANLGKGAAVGSLLIPNDAAVDPTNPLPAIQAAGMFIAAGAEGAAADFTILKSLGVIEAVAKQRGATNVAKSAEAALKLFGQGENRSTFERAMGGAVLGGTSEAALQTASLQDPTQILAASGLVMLAGATLGGAVASLSLTARQQIATPRTLRVLDEGETLLQRAERQLDFERGIIKQTKAAESGLGPQTAFLDRVDAAAAARQQAIRLEQRGALGFAKPTLPPDLPKLDVPELDRMFDPKAPQTFVESLGGTMEELRTKWENSFVYEASIHHLPSVTRVRGLTLADDFRRFRHAANRTNAIAERDLKNVLAPLGGFAGKDYTTASDTFVRLVVLRDLAETVQRGLELPGGLAIADIQRNLTRLETASPPAVLQAAEHHRLLVNEMRQDLIRRGKLPQDAGYEHYYPHQMIEDLALDDAYTTGRALTEIEGSYPTSGALRRGVLQAPKRGYTRQRAGSTRMIDTNYIETMYRAVRRFHMDNALDDFLTGIEKTFSLKRSQLDEEMLRGLNRVGRFVWQDGNTYRLFKPRGPAFYRVEAASQTAWETLEKMINEGQDITLDNLPELKELLVVGRGKEFLLPIELAERLDQFYAPDPLAGKTLSARWAVAEWKRNTIYWGGTRFSVFQILGDSINLARSNPAAFLQIRNRKLDSSVLRAINEQFHKYGTPPISLVQAANGIAGGIGGATLNEVFESEDPSMLVRVGAILAGAGLGYLTGTYVMRGAIRAGSQVYDLADDWGAINSGFIASEEALNRRTLANRAIAWPGKERSNWQRGLDSIWTLMTGKAHGSPFPLVGAPARIVEIVQTERENTLRLASFMQMTEKGMPPALAAKRASESLVDYLKFTEFENRYFRGFWFPFYGFYRQNIPNWIKAAVGRDVGGKTTVAMAALGAIAAGDIIAQAWNESFFPEVERAFTERRRQEFHIIVGNPFTGEVYADVHGKPMVVGWEMPYEQALEFFGLARPGYIYSMLFGIAGEKANIDLVEQAKLTARDIALGKGMRDYAIQLLSPFIKEPLQLALNKDLFFESAILPERYWDTAEGRRRATQHVLRTFFRQYREARRTATQLTGRRFDPLTSAFGLGLPISNVNIDREMQGWLHEEMDEAEKLLRQKHSKWQTELDDLIYSREKFTEMPPDEPQKAEEIAIKAGLEGEELAAAKRYYQSRGFQTSLQRRVESMPREVRQIFFDRLPEFGQTALTYYMNLGDNLFEDAASLENLPSILGR